MKINRYKESYEEVEVPDGFKVCQTCKGKGAMSKYDRGWTSFVHSPELAAMERCWICNGQGFVVDFEDPDWETKTEKWKADIAL
jgi:DnaJ-class molecular chaperone